MKQELIDLLDFNNKYKGWDGFEFNPYNRKNGFQIDDGVKFPDSKGIYMFKSKLSGVYYIGKAEHNLNNRLKTKLKNDMNEKRVTNYRNLEGKLFHDYPYLPIYDTEDTEVYFLKTRTLSKSSIAERILLSAYHIIYGELPASNRTGIPAYAKLKQDDAQDALREIADNFLL